MRRAEFLTANEAFSTAAIWPTLGIKYGTCDSLMCWAEVLSLNQCTHVSPVREYDAEVRTTWIKDPLEQLGWLYPGKICCCCSCCWFVVVNQSAVSHYWPFLKSRKNLQLNFSMNCSWDIFLLIKDWTVPWSIMVGWGRLLLFLQVLGRITCYIIVDVDFLPL